jgi:hypothetical protein
MASGLQYLYSLGEFMKTKTSFQNKFTLQTATLLLLAVAFLTGCGNTKSNPTTTTATNPFNISGQKAMANCNKTKDSNFSINTASVIDQNGQTNSDWIKIKFNFLSTAVTASGNTIRFFKWRVIGTESQLDNTPLAYASFDLSSGQTVGSTVNVSNAADITPSNGFYIQLNDPNMAYQVLKVVIYNSSGQIVAQMNSLIPGFYASPYDYQYNPDGTARSSFLLQLHNLYGAADVANWNTVQLQQAFDQYCF